MEEKFKQWDEYIHEMLICITTAQKKYNHFILADLKPKEPYDLFFFRLSFIANTFVKKCKIYGYVDGFFNYFLFKMKEHQLRKIPYEVMFRMPSDDIHICSREERIMLIEEIAKKHNVKPEDIATIYKEYYSR